MDSVLDHRSMIRRPKVLLALAALFALGASACARPPRIEAISGFAQGTTYTLQWWTSSDVDRDALGRELTRELERIDSLLSNYRPDSALERLNASDGASIEPVPAELVALLRLAGEVHRASSGCFDPTVRPLVHLWGFDGDNPHVPPDDEIADAMGSVGFAAVEILDDEHVRKRSAGVQVDMSSIGQGYTVGRLASIAEGFGLTSYLAEIGGELVARGRRPDGTAWRVGIERPDAPGRVLRALSLPPDRATAVITSGTYRHYFEDHGSAYSHVIDPRTGRPVQHALVSVTVTGTDPAHAAAWATALLCLGEDDAAVTADREMLSAVLVVRADDGFELRPSTAFARAWPSTEPGED
jgi:thiamine biosynthesis lipoprotein